eukprot:scaffold95271_cov37-Prasinocladus_malaysianus.AAC.1
MSGRRISSCLALAVLLLQLTGHETTMMFRASYSKPTKSSVVQRRRRFRLGSNSTTYNRTSLQPDSPQPSLYDENLAIKYPHMHRFVLLKTSQRMFRVSGGCKWLSNHISIAAGVLEAIGGGKRFNDGDAMLYPAADGRDSVVCLSEKTGSSR